MECGGETDENVLILKVSCGAGTRTGKACFSAGRKGDGKGAGCCAFFLHGANTPSA